MRDPKYASKNMANKTADRPNLNFIFIVFYVCVCYALCADIILKKNCVKL